MVKKDVSYDGNAYYKIGCPRISPGTSDGFNLLVYLPSHPIVFLLIIYFRVFLVGCFYGNLQGVHSMF